MHSMSPFMVDNVCNQTCVCTLCVSCEHVDRVSIPVRVAVRVQVCIRCQNTREPRHVYVLLSTLDNCSGLVVDHGLCNACVHPSLLGSIFSNLKLPEIVHIHCGSFDVIAILISYIDILSIQAILNLRSCI